jgi:hypothetical protein
MLQELNAFFQKALSLITLLVMQVFDLLPSPCGACIFEWLGARLLAHGMPGRKEEQQDFERARGHHKQACPRHDRSQCLTYVPHVGVSFGVQEYHRVRIDCSPTLQLASPATIYIDK